MTTPVELKILQYRVPTIRVLESDQDAVQARLQKMFEQRPDLFKGLDVAVEYPASLPETFNKDSFHNFLSSHGLNLVGRRKGSDDALLFNKNVPAGDAADEVVKQRLRSGQRVYAKGNLVILGTVSSGAEVLSEGSIHIYGELRGRALAGVQGDRNAAVYTNSMQAELVSIAGVYRLGEQIEDDCREGPCRVVLEGDLLSFEPISD